MMKPLQQRHKINLCNLNYNEMTNKNSYIVKFKEPTYKLMSTGQVLKLVHTPKIKQAANPFLQERNTVSPPLNKQIVQKSV